MTRARWAMARVTTARGACGPDLLGMRGGSARDRAIHGEPGADRGWSRPAPGGPTERGGFEPPSPLRRTNGFRDRRIRPLCHLSARERTSARPIRCRGLERCPSGLRSATGNRVVGHSPARGFKSLPLRSGMGPGVLLVQGAGRLSRVPPAQQGIRGRGRCSAREEHRHPDAVRARE